MKKILTFLFLIISSNIFAQSHTTFNKTDVDNIINDMKTVLAVREIKLDKGTACYEESVDDVSSLKTDENCLWWKDNWRMIDEAALDLGVIYGEMVIAVALGNITQQALASYNMNMYVYKEIEGEMQKLNIAEYFQILGDRDVDLMKKLTLIGIFEK
jgi:hypothetical protein